MHLSLKGNGIFVLEAERQYELQWLATDLVAFKKLYPRLRILSVTPYYEVTKDALVETEYRLLGYVIDTESRGGEELC